MNKEVKKFAREDKENELKTKLKKQKKQLKLLETKICLPSQNNGLGKRKILEKKTLKKL